MADVLKGRVALITGASRGVGRAIAETYADEGMRLALCARSTGDLQRVADGVADRAEKVLTVKTDVGRDDDIANAVETTRRELGEIEVLVNNAGMFVSGSIPSTTPEQWDLCMNVNVRAPFMLCRAVIPSMIERRWGKIINIGSSSGYAGFPNNGVYCTTKHALLGLSRTLREELKEHGIRVHTVSLGTVDTAMGEPIRTEKGHDPSSFMTAEEVADFVLYLTRSTGKAIVDEVRLNRMQIRMLQ